MVTFLVEYVMNAEIDKNEIRQRINQLKAERRKVQSEHSSLKRKQEDINQQIRSAITESRRLADAIKEEEKKLYVGGVQITDHALLRYIQRVCDIDVSELRKEMIPSTLKNQIDVLGNNGTFPAINGKGKQYNLRIVDGVITTVVV